jgi:PAS domain S-box-containing protein
LLPPELLEEEDMIISKIKKGEQVLHFDTIRIAKDGRRINISLTISPVKNKQGIITGASKIARDITEQKQAEEKVAESEAQFRQMTNLIPAKITNRDAEGGVTYYNKSWLDYAGMSFEELKDFGYNKIIHPDDLGEFQKRFQIAAETGTILEMEMRFKNKDGGYKWHLNRATPLKDDEGRIKMWIGATTDIHDQKTKDQAKDEFIGIASHELKTPLTTAKAYIQLLEMGMEKTNDKDLLFIKKAGASIDRLNDLIGELMDVSKIQNGKLALNISAFNFNEMVADAAEAVQYASPLHNIILSGEIKESVKGDKERLKQVIINLLSNAVKYSPKANEVFINIIQKNGEIEVSIKDDGIGIRKESIEKIFERYYREEQRAVHFQGLGIGLFISYEIIQRHNGKIWAESEPGKGSTFHFTIPMPL